MQNYTHTQNPYNQKKPVLWLSGCTLPCVFPRKKSCIWTQINLFYWNFYAACYISLFSYGGYSKIYDFVGWLRRNLTGGTSKNGMEKLVRVPWVWMKKKLQLSQKKSLGSIITSHSEFVLRPFGFSWRTPIHLVARSLALLTLSFVQEKFNTFWPFSITFDYGVTLRIC